MNHDTMMDAICEMESEDFPRYEVPASTTEPARRVTRVTTVTRLNGRVVAKGREVSIRGLRGRYRFRARRVNEDMGVDEVDVWPVRRNAKGGLRTVRTERIRTVHNVRA